MLSHFLRSLFILSCTVLSTGCASGTGYWGTKKSSLRSEEATHLQTGFASYYAPRFANRKTASGEKYNPSHLTAAHKTLPMGTIVLVRRQSDKRYVLVRINDRGPFVKGRVIDLSEAAARKLDMKNEGVVKVEVFVVPQDSPLLKKLEI